MTVHSPLRRFALWLTLATLPALTTLGGCSTNPATGEQSFTAFMDAEDEARVGAQEHPKMIKEFGGAYADGTLQDYAQRIGEKLAAVSELPKLEWTFTILNDPAINAFALPGGYVYITRGLMALAENEAEMAGVLAHEIGHVTARHSAQRYSTAKATNIGLTGLSILGSVFGVPSGVGQLVSLGANAALQQYSQGQELEADSLGVRYLIRAGYAPDAMSSFFHKMKGHADLQANLQNKEKRSHSIMSTHPRTEDRITQAIKLAKEKSVANPVIRRHAYLRHIDGMVFGDDPAQGVVEGRAFLHPKLKITFRAPPGFVLINSPTKILGFGPKDSKARFIFDMADPKLAPAVRSLRRYIESGWKHGLELRGVERFRVNGMAGATGEARMSGQDGPRDVRLVAIQLDTEHIYRFAFITPPSESRRLNEELRRTTYSFRRLSDAEADAVQPLRIGLVKVRRGDTVAKLARRFPFERFRREWFRLLNGLGPDDSLRPGRNVKVVTGQ